GNWAVEDEGVVPDIEVVDRPDLVAAGRDPSLERAVQELLAERERNPPKPVVAPPAPTRFPKVPERVSPCPRTTAQGPDLRALFISAGTRPWPSRGRLPAFRPNALRCV